MTDTEIIKALECCRNQIPMCDDCPVGSGGMCFDFLKDYAIGLINRQKAEIERLTDLINEIAEANEDLVRDNHDLYVSLKKRDAEIEKLKRQIENIEQEAELEWERKEMLDAL